QQLGRLDLGDHVGEREADALEPPDRLTELLPLGRPVDREVEHPPCPADARRRDTQPARTEPLVHQLEAATLVAETLAHRHTTPGERQLALVVPAVRDTRRPARDAEPRRVHVDEESGDTAAPPAR